MRPYNGVLGGVRIPVAVPLRPAPRGGFRRSWGPCRRLLRVQSVPTLMGMRLEGIHHISAITGDAARNVDFYARVLGLRLVAKTVNQDDPGVYHLFYADERGRPGAEITFFE